MDAPQGLVDDVCLSYWRRGLTVRNNHTKNQELEAKQINYEGRFLISDRAHIVFDFHQEVDGYNEENLGRNKIGACVRACVRPMVWSGSA